MKRTSSPRKAAVFVAVMVSLIFGMASSLYAQQSTPEVTSHFGGPNSVGGQLKKDSEATAAVPWADDLLEPYFDFKKRVEQNYGFAFGIDYNALFQVATERPGHDRSRGSRFSTM